ncbi:MAG: hypothetical protein R3264_05560 [Anaerolineae bacterium]|nr:hypothetical protein [Anaerolineae bacterium]
MTEKILTLHPAGKQGVNIDKAKYDVIKAAIVETLQATPGLTFTELNERITAQLEDNFDGSIGWYVVSVKLDLEARGLLERIPKTSPQQLRLTA